MNQKTFSMGKRGPTQDMKTLQVANSSQMWAGRKMKTTILLSYDKSKDMAYGIKIKGSEWSNELPTSQKGWFARDTSYGNETD
jgi:hypothetical protein